MFRSRLSLGDLVNLCRVLRYNLGAGLPIVTVFTQQSTKGPRAVRPIAGRLAERMRGGQSLTAALEPEKERFPPLFLSMAQIGEETGHAAEIFRELEKYFELVKKLKRQFVSQSILPALQFLAAIFIVAGLILALGLIGESRNPPVTIKLFGLSGPRGAMTFLIFAFGIIGTLIAFYRFMLELTMSSAIDGLILRIPVLGTCLEAFAVTRLALCLQMTLDSGMSIIAAIRMSLTAMENSAYTAHTEEVVAALRKQRPVAEALALVRPLPTQFLEMVAVAEEGGQVPEMMRHQAEHYQEESSRRLAGLTKAANVCFYLIYAGFTIYGIFTIVKFIQGTGAYG